MAKSDATKRIIKREFERKREEILRMKQLDLTLEKRHMGIDDFKKGDMKPFVKETKTKLKKLRKDNLIK
ncbi:hypothetical protein QUA56_08095 [Microcoleus sp. N3A4]|uniref:hypothetical protein n=1 Tax=Microcoleus sp. N3A4 TaxID=3055379 RepID=UPI002FD75371